MVANKAGDHATAELLLRKLVVAQPNNVEAKVALADLYTTTAPRSKRAARETSTPRVLEQLHEATRLAPENVGLQLRLMRTLFDANQVKNATEAARKAVELGTDDRLAMYLAALTALEDNDKTLATMFEHILDGDYHDIHAVQFYHTVLYFLDTDVTTLLNRYIDAVDASTGKMVDIYYRAYPSPG